MGTYNLLIFPLSNLNVTFKSVCNVKNLYIFPSSFPLSCLKLPVTKLFIQAYVQATENPYCFVKKSSVVCEVIPYVTSRVSQSQTISIQGTS